MLITRRRALEMTSAALVGTAVQCDPLLVTADEKPTGKVTPDANYEQCWERSIAEIKKAVPQAEDLGIHILIENVWNDFLTDPKETARFIDACGSGIVGAHFDIGNAVRYSPPHEWIP